MKPSGCMTSTKTLRLLFMVPSPPLLLSCSLDFRIRAYQCSSFLFQCFRVFLQNQACHAKGRTVSIFILLPKLEQINAKVDVKKCIRSASARMASKMMCCSFESCFMY